MNETSNTTLAVMVDALGDIPAPLARAFLAAAPDGVIICGTDGVIVYINDELVALFGYRRDELVGQRIELIMPERFRDRHQRHRDDFARAPRRRPMGVGLDLWGRRQDGSEFPIEISLSPVRVDGADFVIASVRDVNAHKQAEAQLKANAKELAKLNAELRRSNADLEQFAYVASHDLQEPLRMVASYTQLLARRYRGQLDRDADEFIGFAVDGARRMQELIQDLLAYSRVNTRGRAFEPVDCNYLVDQALADLAVTIADTNATVTRDDLPTVSGDPSQLRHLFLNLIGNGVKFHRNEPPIVHVGAERVDDDWRFFVRDNGIGVDPRFADRVFVIFQRLHTRAEFPGTGIGLAICKKIVERHGGQIWFDSQPETRPGATFFFTLPVQTGGEP